MPYKTIITEVQDHIGLIRLNRPDALNSLNAELIKELGESLREFDGSNKVRVIILTGSEKAFAAGADITEMATKDFNSVSNEDFMGDFQNNFVRIRKPIIAAVSGYALGLPAGVNVILYE